MSFPSYWRVALVAAATLPSAAQADTSSLAARLELFKANPKALLNTIPKKVSLSGGQAVEFFPADALKNRNFVAAKNADRNAVAGRAAIQSNDDPAHLVDNADSMITNIREMDEKKLRQAEVKTQPWSD